MSLDLTGVGPTTVCVCGGRTFKILATFDDGYELATYSAEMYCDSCGARLEAPMPGVNC